MARLRRPVAVALFSAAALTYEVLLVRVFAIEQFHHFAYMAISVAMLGFGASGTLLALGGRLSDADAERLFRWSGITASLSLVASPILVDRIAFDATQLAWDTGQWLRLAGVYLCLAFPFGANALAVLLGITLERARPGRIYGASFLGSGLGGVLALVALWLVFPTRSLAIPALLAAAGAITCVTHVRVPRLVRVSVWTTAIVSVAVFVRPLWTLDVNPYKGLPQVEAYPDARRVAEYSSPLGWVVAVEAPAQRYAPGLSLLYRGELPPQTALFVDGQMIGAFSRPNADSAAVEYLDWLPTALPYALPQRRNVLILGAGAGTEVSNALVHNVDSVVAVELHPDVVRLAAGGRTGGQAGRRADGQMGRRADGSSGNAGVVWVVGDARSYVARTARRFDLITLGATGGMGTAAAGVHSLGEDFLHTVDAYVSYLDHLTPDGVLAITRWLTTPPRENVRVILTVADALHRASPETAGEGLFVMRSWATVTVLAKPSGFSAEDIESLAAWSRVHGFDVDWYTGLDQPIGEFHLLEEPVLFEAAAAGTAGGDAAADFAAGYPFAVHPVSDARPYPHHFLRPSSIGTFLTTSRGTWLPFAEWGYIALVATLIQSIVLAAVLTIVPVAVGARRVRSAFSLPLAGYFGAIGLAYLAAEIAAIQQLSLLLGHPIYAVAAVLTVFLICSGFGSLWSDRVAVRHGPAVLGAAAFLLLIHAAVLLRLVHLFQSFPLPIRVLAGMIAVAPVAFLMGLPFPLGLRTLARNDTARTAWAWATNGFASVVAAPLAALIALEMGSPAVFLLAAIFYSVAAWIQHAAAGAVEKPQLHGVVG